jgi:putative phosphoesterase
MRSIGVISDTHGLLRPEALEALAGVERILHAGDIGTAEILTALQRVAPVTAVRGNNDRGPWADRIAEQEELEIEGQRLLILHDLKALERSEGYAAVITGHSHKPGIARRGGVLFLNPGSAGPRRFNLPITVAKLRISRGAIDAEILPLNPASDRPGSPRPGAGTKSGRSSSSRRVP